MRSRTARTNAARIIGVGISLLILGACDRSVTAPDRGEGGGALEQRRRDEEARRRRAAHAEYLLHRPLERRLFTARRARHGEAAKAGKQETDRQRTRHHGGKRGACRVRVSGL